MDKKTKRKISFHLIFLIVGILAVALSIYEIIEGVITNDNFMKFKGITKSIVYGILTISSAINYNKLRKEQ